MMSSMKQAVPLAAPRAWLARFLAAAFAALVLLGPAAAQAQDDYYDDTDPSALTDFRADLDPYGAWVDDPTYGTVWLPHSVVVGADFMPYRSAGHWAVTEGGEWMWVSDFAWGHIPFHYGRWVWIPARGWAWIPGRVYAPAWVVWRVGAPGYDYVGWAPMGPSFYWVGGVAVGFYGTIVLPFWYVESPWLFHPLWHHHFIHDHHHIHDVHHHSHYVDHGHHGASGHVGADADVADVDAPPTGAAKGGAASALPPDLRARPVSPTFEQARIGAAQQPKARVKDNPNALAYAKPVAKGGKGSAPQARVTTPPAAAHPAAAPARQSPTARPTSRRPSSAPVLQPRAPVVRPRTPVIRPSTPSQAPVLRPRPRVTPPAVQPSPAPRVTPPSRPSPRITPPAAPTRRSTSGFTAPRSVPRPSHFSRPSAGAPKISVPSASRKAPPRPAATVKKKGRR